MAFITTVTADGYTNAISHNGGPTEFRVTGTADGATVSLRRCSKELSKATAANYVEFDTETTVTDVAGKKIEPGECWLSFLVSSAGGSTDLTLELTPMENRVDIQDTGVVPA